MKKNDKKLIQLSTLVFTRLLIYWTTKAKDEISLRSHYSGCLENVFAPCHDNAVLSHLGLGRKYRERRVVSIALSIDKDLVRKQQRVALNKQKLFQLHFLSSATSMAYPEIQAWTETHAIDWVALCTCTRFSSLVELEYSERKRGWSESHQCSRFLKFTRCYHINLSLSFDFPQPSLLGSAWKGKTIASESCSSIFQGYFRLKNPFAVTGTTETRWVAVELRASVNHNIQVWTAAEVRGVSEDSYSFIRFAWQTSWWILRQILTRCPQKVINAPEA